MQKNPVVGNVNKILLGAILWTVFYLRLFFDEVRWNQTFFGQTVPNLYQMNILYGIQIVFFAILSLNLFHYTVGKRHAVLDLPRFFKVFIFSAGMVLIVQAVSLYLQFPSHYGVIGYLFGEGDYAVFTRSLPLSTYGLYVAATMIFVLYLTGVIVYLYQVIKMKLTFSLAYVIRYVMILGLYGLALGHTPLGFEWGQLGVMVVYVLAAFIVYIKTKYSLRALILAVFLLFIL
jgi:hypothetical protein